MSEGKDSQKTMDGDLRKARVVMWPVWFLVLPLLLAWLVFCVIGTSAVMGLIYLTDPQNRAPEDPR